MLSSGALFVGLSNYFSAKQIDEDGDLELNKVGHFVLDEDEKMLSNICGCSQSNGRLQEFMSLQFSLLFPSESWFQICSHRFGSFVSDIQTDRQENLQETMDSLYLAFMD